MEKLFDSDFERNYICALRSIFVDHMAINHLARKPGWKCADSLLLVLVVPPADSDFGFVSDTLFFLEELSETFLSNILKTTLFLLWIRLLCYQGTICFVLFFLAVFLHFQMTFFSYVNFLSIKAPWEGENHTWKPHLLTDVCLRGK